MPPTGGGAFRGVNSTHSATRSPRTLGYAPVDIKVSANVVTFYTYSPLSTRVGRICNSSKSDGLSLQHKLRKGPSFSSRGFERSTPPGKTRRGGFTLPILPYRRIAPILSSRCISVETKDLCAGERRWFRTPGSIWFHSPPGVPYGSTPHRGSLSLPGEIVPLPIRGVFPHRGRSLHSPPGESFPTGGDHFTPHWGSLSPQGEIIQLPTWGVSPHTGRPFHLPLGESLPVGGELFTPYRGSLPLTGGNH
jgi:hypothetical protein